MGSNLGFRLAHLRDGLRELRKLAVPLAVSGVIETPPFGPQDQPHYLNLVAALHTELSPLALLRWVKEIERRVGRRPTYRWGPRVLDLDLLLYGDLRMESPNLTLPHPRMAERDFVTRPLRQIAPEVADGLSRQ
jgi:2-amino-4-hydroxy-6-hydroxymethyldihydropteridine diphosphokinase